MPKPMDSLLQTPILLPPDNRSLKTKNENSMTDKLCLVSCKNREMLRGKNTRDSLVNTARYLMLLTNAEWLSMRSLLLVMISSCRLELACRLELWGFLETLKLLRMVLLMHMDTSSNFFLGSWSILRRNGEPKQTKQSSTDSWQSWTEFKRTLKWLKQPKEAPNSSDNVTSINFHRNSATWSLE